MKFVPALAFAAALLAAAPAQSQIRAEGAWARPTVAGQLGGGGFVVLHNDGTAPDRLIGGSTALAKRLELHTMEMAGNVMQMREIDAITVPAKGKVALEPGGLHVMFLGLHAPLKAGDKLPVVLKFEKAGELKVDFEIATGKPGAGGHGHGQHK